MTDLEHEFARRDPDHHSTTWCFDRPCRQQSNRLAQRERGIAEAQLTGAVRELLVGH